MLTLDAACVAIVPRPRFVRAVDASVRSLRLLALASLPPMLLLIVVENEASFPSAAASSLSVSNAAGAEATRPATADETNAVVAICVLFVPAVAVGAVGVPVNAGDALAAYVLLADDCVR